MLASAHAVHLRVGIVLVDGMIMNGVIGMSRISVAHDTL